MRRRCALSFVIVAALLADSGKGEEPGGKHVLVPDGLKNWSVEYRARCPREGDIEITIDSTGAVRVKHFRVAKRSELTLSAAEITAIFATSKDLFNHYRARGGAYPDTDVDYLFTLKSNDSPMVELKMSPGSVGSLGLNPFLTRLDAVLREHGIKDAESFQQRDPREDEPQQELIPTNLKEPWGLSISHGSEPRFDRVARFGATGASLVINNSLKTTMKYPAEHGDKTYDLARRFFNEYTLPIATTDAKGVEEKYFPLEFNCSTVIEVSCSRQMLIKMGLLEEFDALVADANRRLAEKDGETRFQAPWEE